MKKVLFLPFLLMQSGHHQVADALMDILKRETDEITVKKIDLLSYTNQSLEKLITNGYLKWIRYAPEIYDLAYKKFFYGSTTKEHSFKWYHYFFLKKMEQLLMEENPDLIVCTHGFPSYLLSQLKRKGKNNIPNINVYTDFFINNVWGREEIDFHFLPSQDVKEELRKNFQIPDKNMIVTGIPVHKEITKKTKLQINRTLPKILVAGGSNGLGDILELLEGVKQSTQAEYFVLCGKNNKLYEEILSWKLAHIKPLSYISSRSEMNHIYDEMDAIVTKPGGVTISEVLQKRIPIFIHSALPGQEEINQEYLINKGLVFELKKQKPFEQELLGILNDSKKVNQWENSINFYQKGIEIEGTWEIAEKIKCILESKIKSIQSSKFVQSKAFRVAKA
ncbi:MGDG synthase family glycosyltransferase [Bacillus sp. UNC438CL73TsuS30]|uniref:MGDG synthase family glycosyltransferase n=1 Tax=Bacillus sp. UNC438CL73TsuS30 TaxID=1340434 RepID=UPI000554250C|nr:glycosyltransferase [Bacillus sp. UNC438CL73TsuS30]